MTALEMARSLVKKIEEHKIKGATAEIERGSVPNWADVVIRYNDQVAHISVRGTDGRFSYLVSWTRTEFASDLYDSDQLAYEWVVRKFWTNT